MEDDDDDKKKEVKDVVLDKWEDSGFFACWQTVNDNQQYNANYRKCLCLIRPEDASCDECNISFNNPKCCEKAFINPIKNELEYTYCCSIYKTNK